jgi:sulfur-oxidizing protein SoxY
MCAWCAPAFEAPHLATLLMSLDRHFRPDAVSHAHGALPGRRQALLAALAAVAAGGLCLTREVGAVTATGLQWPLVWPSGSVEAALRALGAEPAPPGTLRLEAPDRAENGAVVPVSVSCDLPGTTDIHLIVDTNPDPEVVHFVVPPGTEAFVGTRIKMAESGHVCVLVRAQGRLYAAVRATQVVMGGCG